MTRPSQPPTTPPPRPARTGAAVFALVAVLLTLLLVWAAGSLADRLRVTGAFTPEGTAASQMQLASPFPASAVPETDPEGRRLSPHRAGWQMRSPRTEAAFPAPVRDAMSSLRPHPAPSFRVVFRAAHILDGNGRLRSFRRMTTVH